MRSIPLQVGGQRLTGQLSQPGPQQPPTHFAGFTTGQQSVQPPQQEAGQPAQQPTQFPPQAQQQPTQPGSQALQSQAQQPSVQLSGQQSAQQLRSMAAPFVDIYDSTDELIVYADIAGVTAENIRLEGNERQLRIIADRPTEGENEGFTPIQQERPRRTERTIELPTDVEVDESEATCENGVCKIRLPKSGHRAIGVQ